MKTIINPKTHLQSVVQVSPIKQIEWTVRQTPGSISLAQGIPSWNTPERIRCHIIDQLREVETAQYTDPRGVKHLRNLVADRLQRQGLTYDPETEILITVGAAEAITSTLLSLITPERNQIVVPSPSYAGYLGMIRAAGGVPVFVPMDGQQGWKLDLDLMAEAVTDKTAAVLIANPNNPTGHIYSQVELMAMADLAREHNIQLILDQVYEDFVFHPEISLKNPANLPENRRYITGIYSFSKAYGMTGYRVAYLYADQSMVDRIVGIHDSAVTCAPAISQQAAIAALEVAQPDLEHFQGIIAKRRVMTGEWFERLGDFFEYSSPAGAYFAFPRVKSGQSGTDFAMELLEATGVAVVPGEAFGPGGEGHVRICFGRGEDDLRTAFERMEKHLRG